MEMHRKDNLRMSWAQAMSNTRGEPACYLPTTGQIWIVYSLTIALLVTTLAVDLVPPLSP